MGRASALGPLSRNRPIGRSYGLPELHSPDRARRYFPHTHEVTLSPADGLTTSVDVVALDHLGRAVTVSFVIEPDPGLGTGG